MPRVRERGGYRGDEAPTGRLRPLPGAPPSAAAAARRSSTFPARRTAPPSHPLLADPSGPAPPGRGVQPSGGAQDAGAQPQEARGPRCPGAAPALPRRCPGAAPALPRRCGHIPRPPQADTPHGLTCSRDPRARAASQPPPSRLPAAAAAPRAGRGLLPAQAPPRPAARDCTLPSSEERRLHNFVRERPAPAAPPPPPPACPFVGEPRGRPGGGGRPRETRSRAGARGCSLRGGRPGPRRRRPSNFVRGQRPLSAPARPPARPRRPPRAGLRERGAPGHLTARPPLPRRLGGRRHQRPKMRGTPPPRAHPGHTPHTPRPRFGSSGGGSPRASRSPRRLLPLPLCRS
eukprot:XP_005615745.1 basic proline-rich protein-like [Canis lupus familiaris]